MNYFHCAMIYNLQRKGNHHDIVIPKFHAAPLLVLMGKKKTSINAHQDVQKATVQLLLILLILWQTSRSKQSFPRAICHAAW